MSMSSVLGSHLEEDLRVLLGLLNLVINALLEVRICVKIPLADMMTKMVKKAPSKKSSLIYAPFVGSE